jgi:hypothetical protein
MGYSDSRTRYWLCVAGLATIAVAMYAPTFSFGFTYLDDSNLILNQRQFLERPSSLLAVFGRTYFPSAFDTYYRPLVNLSIVINWQLSQARPLGYHILNSGLHALACVLVYALLVELRQGSFPAFLATLIFAVHPVQVASVAWIPGRNDTLLSCFALGACLTMLRAGGGWLPRLGHVLCLLGALLSKETAVCLPLVFLLAFRGARVGGAPRVQRWMWVSWASLYGLYFAVRGIVITAPPGYVTDRIHAAAKHFPLLLADIGKLVFPWRLQVIAAPEDVLVWPGGIIVGAVLVLALLLRGLRRHILLLSVTMIIAPLLVCLPATNSVVLDNRLYLPMAGWAMLVSELLRVLASDHRAFILAAGVTGITALVFGHSTLRYSRNFENRIVFSQAALEASPNSSTARHLRFRSFYASELGSMLDDTKGQ